MIKYSDKMNSDHVVVFASFREIPHGFLAFLFKSVRTLFC